MNEKRVRETDPESGSEAQVSLPCISQDERKGTLEATPAGRPGESGKQEGVRGQGRGAKGFVVRVHGAGCKECNYCVEVCEVGVFGPREEFNDKGYRMMEAKHPERCVGCLSCFFACPDFAIDVEEMT